MTSTAPSTVLIAEDDIQIRNFMAYALKAEGCTVLQANTAKKALSILIHEQVDILLLDLGLPDSDGMEVLQQVREWTDLPVIVVSARDQDKDKVEALDAGADDYLTKPFSANELLARIRVALRHRDRVQTSPATLYEVGELQIDVQKRIVLLSGEEIHLTPLEYNLLTLFFKNIGKVLTTQTILREIYGVGYGTDTQALRTLMAGLRRKIETTPAKPRYIITEIGVGYRLVDN